LKLTTPQKYICAFLNTEGGTLYIGVLDDGTIVGVWFTRKMRDKLRLRVDALISNFRPAVDPHLWSLDFIPVEIVKSGMGRRGSRNAKKKIHQLGVSAPPPDLDDDDKENQQLYVVRIKVGGGRAPLYFTPKAEAFYRFENRKNKKLAKKKKLPKKIL
jgi:predicted HTH transcriptional regulator